MTRTTKRIDVAISCLTCEHFHLELGEPGYGEMTPGSPPVIGCAKERKKGCPWKEIIGAATWNFISVAEKCAFFEVDHDLAVDVGSEIAEDSLPEVHDDR